jgi:serine/threonine protein kinase
MMKSYYADKHPIDASEIKAARYRSNYQQIADYVVYNAEEPANSSCNAQYMCFRNSGGNRRYYIIREYTTANQSVIATRENEVLSRLWNDNIEYPQGIVRYRTMETAVCDNPDDARLFVIYEMNGQPRHLNREIISRWDHLMKLRMMALLCDAVKNLHSMKIFHRNLNLNSVYVYEMNSQYGINLTSFEFSKLSVNSGNRTVISQVVKNHNPNLIFTAPEIKKELSEEDYSRLDWEKADIYSLGVLLAFIISDGAFLSESKKRTNISAIIREYEDEYPENMIQLLLSMCNENRFKRPDASQVHFIIRRCYEKARDL